MWWRKPEVKFVNGRLTGAIISKSSGGDAFSINYFTDAVERVCNYVEHELPTELIQVRYADYYLEQVNNGGHSQFVGNSGAKLANNIEHALAGLRNMGARRQVEILTQLKAWIEANPTEAALQKGFGEFRAPYLDELDERFYDAEERSSIGDLCASWIQRWSNLEIVDDDRFVDRMRALGAQNPNFDIRSIFTVSQKNRRMLTGELYGPIAVACGAVQPEPDVLISVNAGQHIDFEGKSLVQWSLSTDKGRRYAVVREDGAILFESADRKQIASVDADRIKQFASAVETMNADIAVDLILRRVGLPPSEVGSPGLAAWNIDENQATWIAQIELRKLVIRTKADRAALLDEWGNATLSLSTEEIAAHRALAIRGRASMQLKI